MNLNFNEDFLISITPKIHCIGGVNGDNPTELTSIDIRSVMEAFLKDSKEVDFASFYAYCDKDIAVQLLKLHNFIPVKDYPFKDNIVDNEIGCVGNIRFILNNKLKITPNSSILGHDIHNILCTLKYNKEIIGMINLMTTL